MELGAAARNDISNNRLGRARGGEWMSRPSPGGPVLLVPVIAGCNSSGKASREDCLCHGAVSKSGRVTPYSHVRTSLGAG